MFKCTLPEHVNPLKADNVRKKILIEESVYACRMSWKAKKNQETFNNMIPLCLIKMCVPIILLRQSSYKHHWASATG